MAFSLAVVTDRIDRVVEDVDHPFVLDELASFFLLFRHQLVVLAGHPANALQDPVPIAGGAGVPVDQDVVPLVRQRLVRKQARHS